MPMNRDQTPDFAYIYKMVGFAILVAVFIATGLIGSRVRIFGAEREELQQEVRRLRLEAADVLRNIQSGVISTDGDGRVLYANPAALRLLGLGTAVTVIHPPELIQHLAETARAVAAAYNEQ